MLPQLEDEELEPTLQAQDVVDRPPCGRDKVAYQPEHEPAPHRRTTKNTKAQGYTHDLQDKLENKAEQSRSIYGSWGRAPMREDDRHTEYTKYKSVRAEYRRPGSFELRRDVARHRGAAHPLCFTNEVMEHEFPEGFKPVNIEPYDGTTDPAVWI